jgi:hypothetical protein
VSDSAKSGRRRIGIAAAVVVGAAIAAGVVATVLPAAASDTPSATAIPSASSGAGNVPGRSADSSTPVRSDEKALAGTDAAKVTAAALAAVPGATVYRVETDADGAAYEAHLTKSDGTRATVKLNKDFTVAGIEDGMGATKGGQGAPPPTR